MRSLSFCRCIVVLLALAIAPLVPLRAQMPPARYTPNVDLTNAAYLRALARLPNGKIVVSGNDLQRVNGVPQNYLARLNVDGSLDTNWNPAPNSGVGAIWVDTAGMLYVGGFFSNIAGQPRAGLARFNAAGVLDPNWAPTLNVARMRSPQDCRARSASAVPSPRSTAPRIIAWPASRISMARCFLRSRRM